MSYLINSTVVLQGETGHPYDGLIKSQLLYLNPQILRLLLVHIVERPQNVTNQEMGVHFK